MVYQAIGKYVNPTRSRQIIETASLEHLSTREQGLVSLDQKHTWNVAKVHCQKKQSQQVAWQAATSMEKLIKSSQNKRSIKSSDDDEQGDSDDKDEETEKEEVDEGEEKMKNILNDPEYKFHSLRKTSSLLWRLREAKVCPLFYS